MLETGNGAARVLREHLRTLNLPLDETERARLLELVCDYVDERRAAGWGPERVLVAVKRIAADADLRASSITTSVDAQFAWVDRLIKDMVGWCIERYYNHP